MCNEGLVVGLLIISGILLCETTRVLAVIILIYAAAVLIYTTILVMCITIVASALIISYKILKRLLT
jgi:hypothetical protein